MLFLQELIRSKGFKRFLVLALVILVLYLFRSMMNMLLLLFIMTYLMNELHKRVMHQFKWKSSIVSSIVLILQYIIVIGLISLGISKFIPSVISEFTPLVNFIIRFYQMPFQPLDIPVIDNLIAHLQKMDLITYITQDIRMISKLLANVSKFSMNILFALLLSLFFLLEKERIRQFMSNFKQSKLAYAYQEISQFGRKFISSFGKVLEVQVLISLINSILSVIALWIMGFPSLFALGIMMFALGLVPVAGVVISLLPLCAIAFSIGGFMKVISVLVMVAVLHALEAYILNPKLMSAKTKLPIFFTFMVLLVAEHFMGVWGLILGIPLFIFLLDLFEVKITSPLSKKNKKKAIPET